MLQFWTYFLNWLENVCDFKIRNTGVTEECIFFGIPNTDPDKKEMIHVFNYCLFYAKHYIYIQKLFQNGVLDLYACKVQIKNAVEIEQRICTNKGESHKLKKYECILNNL